MGYTGQIAQIHGGMQYTQREDEVERFRKPLAEGGARFLICTDAAGEGINLQFCWIMINYDVPWNPGPPGTAHGPHPPLSARSTTPSSS